MEIVRKIIFEYILCYLAQSFIITLGLYAFCHKSIKMPQFLIASGMIFVGSVIIRNLPISYGVPTLFIMMVTALVSIWYLKFPTNLSIRSALFMTLILFVGEISNILLLNVLLGKGRFTQVINDTKTKFIYAIPSTVIALLITLIYYLILKKKVALNAEKSEPSDTGSEH
jgi:hypothetical protein